jgi:two-component system sensor histidine kinase DegS
LVFNAVKHARATRVDIDLKWGSARLKAVVKDDGAGFDVSEALEINRQNKHFGLFSLRERLLPLGGRLDLESSRGRGAKAVISLSIRPEKNRGFHHDG